LGLPFLNKKEGSMSGPIEQLERTPDEQPDMDMLDACAHDILEAVSKKDVSMLKAALEALVSHIQDMDQTQDEQEMQ
jgi:hypothetical protein